MYWRVSLRLTSREAKGSFISFVMARRSHFKSSKIVGIFCPHAILPLPWWEGGGVPPPPPALPPQGGGYLRHYVQSNQDVFLLFLISPVHGPAPGSGAVD